MKVPVVYRLEWILDTDQGAVRFCPGTFFSPFMAQLLFSLRDDANLLQGIAQGPGRTYLAEISNFQNFELHLKYLLEISEIFTAARFTHNYINSIEDFNIEITDDEITTIDISKFLLDLPISSFLLLSSITPNGTTRVYKYGIEESGILNTFRTISEFTSALERNGHTLMESEYNDLYNSKERLEALINGKIVLHNVLDGNNNMLNCWSCTYPGCQTTGITIEEYIQHLHDEHNDEYFFMDPIWGDVFRYITKFQTIPKAHDFFHPSFIGGLFIKPKQPEGNNNIITHVFIDQKKYDESLRSAEQFREDGEIEFETKVAEQTQAILIDENSPFEEKITTALLGYELNFTREQEPTILEDVDFQEHIDTSYVLQYQNDEIQESITADTSTDGYEIINQDNIEVFIQEIKNQLHASTTREDITKVRDYILSHTISSELTDIMMESDDTPIILMFLIQHHWLPAAGYSSPFPNETKDFHTPAALATYISKKNPTISKSTKDRGSMYYSSILNDSLPFASYEGERPNIESPLFFCPYLDCSYGTHNSKQISQHTGSRLHSNGHRRMHEFGPFWTAQYDFVSRKDELPSMKEIKRSGETYKCRTCGAQYIRKNEIKNHLMKSHNVVHTAITDDLYQIGQIIFLTIDEIREIKAQTETEMRNELARPLIENVRNQLEQREQEEQNRTDQPNINQEEDQSRAPQQNQEQGNNDDLHNNTQQANEDREEEQAIQQEAADLEYINEILDIRNNRVTNEDLVNKSKEWIINYKQEEDTNIGIPTMTVERRKQIKKDLKTLYNVTLIPLMMKFMPNDSDEEECIKLDGVIYKINHEIREHCRKQLILTRSQVYNRGENQQYTHPAPTTQERRDDQIPCSHIIIE